MDLMQYYELLKEQHGDKHGWWPTHTDNWRFEIMLGCILTQNTAWTNVEKALENLYSHDLIDHEAILEADEDRLKQLVWPSGYYNQKTRRVKRLAAFVSENPINELLERDWKTTRKQLLGIKGIGNETADSILLYALEKPAFVIDAYTKRIVSRWGLVNKDISYEELQERFTKNIPKSVKLYKEYHGLLVEHAKTICKTKPLCEACELLEECEQNI